MAEQPGPKEPAGTRMVMGRISAGVLFVCTQVILVPWGGFMFFEGTSMWILAFNLLFDVVLGCLSEFTYI